MDEKLLDFLLTLKALADKWDTSEYAIAEVNNPLLPQEQCAIELREVIERLESNLRKFHEAEHD
jgi:hypothetical protein